MSPRVLSRFALLSVACFQALFGAPSAFAQGVVPNPEFDVGAVTGWTGNIAQVSWSQTDPDCVPPNASGSLQLVPDNLQGPVSAFLCVAAPTGNANLTFLVRAECQEVVKGILRYYPEPACGGAILGSEETGGTTLGGSWDQAELAPATLPTGTQSVWIGLELSESISSICTALFDRVHLGSGLPLLRSGFETGSTACRWSASVP